mmetsp:Transcript_6454/g.10863  ORF Transcript_6454/g.10863 Transcript_6454/m.10863 type:complete len:180 (-) Transcript_6454:57-596(-)|eukprot:CAMPEP_0174962218 /NCGR_PEP_ID=MMETSP0004_2-20121128/4665_1 /TAXON_ID=420556 /ORGANISM="Ochromonas sp., Strain CCMP1393" /LENGTH=179 /DNA_ID=CAMNT_0016210733 /DNA_START=633 /DNA_END=1172 /DNA_ORIENTATION=-
MASTPAPELVSFRRFVNYLYAIAYLPTDAVPDAFRYICQTKIDAQIQGLPNFAEFRDYYYNTWIADASSYSVADWNLFDDDDHHSNNHVEGHNNLLSKALGSHPNLWEFLLQIKVLHRDSELMEARHRRMHDPPTVRRPQAVLKSSQLASAKQAFRQSPRAWKDVCDLLDSIYLILRKN